MTDTLRIWSMLALAMALILSWAPASRAQDMLPLATPSTSGSYLAGQQALSHLSTSEAAQFFLDATDVGWKDPVLVERAFVALVADGRVDEAADLAKHLLALAPSNELAQITLSVQALKERRYPSAVNHLDGLGTDSFIGITAAVLQAWAHVGQGEQDLAMRLLDKTAQGGLEKFLLFHRALMADVAGDRDQALTWAREAAEADANVPRVVEGYIRMLGNAGEQAKALERFEQFEQSGASHPMLDAAAATIKSGARPGQLANNVQQGASEILFSVGAALAVEGGPELATIFLQLGHYLHEENDVILLALGELLQQADQFEAANAAFTAIAADSPVKPLATVSLAENLDAMGERNEAIRRLRNIVATEPGHIEAISSLGDLLRFDEQFAEAAAVYTQAIDARPGDEPRDWRFYYVRGIANERSDHWDLAEADLLKALELNPGQPQVLNYLGYSWVDKGIRLEEALAMIEQAVAASPADGYIVDSLGWAFFRLGRTEEAVDVLEQAVQLLPNDPEINDHLGDAYWHAGRHLEARFQWRIAASQDTEGNVRDRVQPKLLNGLAVTEPSLRANAN